MISREETKLVLAMLEAAFPQFKPNELSEEIWFGHLGAFTKPIVFKAVDICIAELQSPFGPTIAMFKDFIDRARAEHDSALIEDPLSVFRRGPRGAKNEQQKEAWAHWGGGEAEAIALFGQLPDLRYPQMSQSDANFRWNTEAKRFERTLFGIRKDDAVKNMSLSHDESKAALDMVGFRPGLIPVKRGA